MPLTNVTYLEIVQALWDRLGIFKSISQLIAIPIVKRKYGRVLINSKLWDVVLKKEQKLLKTRMNEDTSLPLDKKKQ